MRIVIVMAVVFGSAGGVVWAAPAESGEAALEYEITDDWIKLALSPIPERSYRVWHTINPMKVIVDLDSPLPALAGEISSADIALERIRTRVDAGSSRIVLDFAYRMPPPEWSFSDGELIVVVHKSYVQSDVHTIEPGVRYGHERRGSPAGPLLVNYLDIRLNHPAVTLSLALAGDTVLGREHVSSMAERLGALAAVNAAFFAPDGSPLGLLAQDGLLISEPRFERTALALRPNAAAIASVGFSGQVTWSGHSLAIDGFNRARGADELIIYTPAYHQETRTNIYGLDVVVQDNKVIDVQAGSTPIPADGYVISGHGTARDFLAGVQIGDPISAEWNLVPDLLAAGYTHIVGGGPRLIADGEKRITGAQELFQRDVVEGRAPRTAIGLTADQRLLLVTVNGRNPGITIGVTLEELADLMLDLGAVEAMNLDGGGSTTMVVRDMVLNIPSDGRERTVSTALMVIHAGRRP